MHYLGGIIGSLLWLNVMVVDQCRPYYRPQTKLRKGNVFTSVCQEFCQQGGCVCQTPTPAPRQADTPPVDIPWQANTPPPTDTPLGRHPSPWQADTPLGRHPLPADGYCSGRYASYWHAFLCFTCFQIKNSTKLTNKLSTVSGGGEAENALHLLQYCRISTIFHFNLAISLLLMTDPISFFSTCKFFVNTNYLCHESWWKIPIYLSAGDKYDLYTHLH